MVAEVHQHNKMKKPWEKISFSPLFENDVLIFDINNGKTQALLQQWKLSCDNHLARRVSQTKYIFLIMASCIPISILAFETASNPP